MRFRREAPWWHHVPLENLRVHARVHDRTDAAGRTVLLPERFRGRWSRWLQRSLPSERRHAELRLDERGAVVWWALKSGDGISVRELVLAYEAARPEELEQAETRVVQFLAGLAGEGCVEFSATE